MGVCCPRTVLRPALVLLQSAVIPQQPPLMAVSAAPHLTMDSSTGGIMFRNLVFAVLFSALVTSSARSQDWASKLFTVTSHDFGTVARDAKTEFQFPLTNIYVEDVHILSATASCGCTIVSVPKPTLKTYERGAIVATFNTPAFQGQHGATITVTFDRPFYAQAQLTVRGFIRSDVVFTPGSVQFGSVEEGAARESRVAISHFGYDQWQILRVQSPNPNLAADVRETGRSAGQVSYELTVRLDKNQPAGYLADHLLLVTNDAQSVQIPLPVEGRVNAAIHVTPESLFMGVLQPGEEVTKQVVIKGAKPFRIRAVSCDDQRFHVGATPADDGLKSSHVIPVTFVAGKEASGKVVRAIRIQTDLDNMASQISAYAEVAEK